ncbi:MAG: hypothetical protein JXB13_05220 [Phycisphaerae bacterium]|nr:hypothetical protein [Phycisphaerae bacterium]
MAGSYANKGHGGRSGSSAELALEPNWCRLTREGPTERKMIYHTYVDGIRFALYVPKRTFTADDYPDNVWVAVTPWEGRVVARVRAGCDIAVVATLHSVHTQTVRYTPIGDPKAWLIGEPYVPMSILPDPYPPLVEIRVRW